MLKLTIKYHFSFYLKPVKKISASDLPRYRKIIEDVVANWRKCKYSQTFKIHWVARHCYDFIVENLFSIGCLSEQDAEAMHAIFKIYDERYKANTRDLACLKWNKYHWDNQPRKEKKNDKSS